MSDEVISILRELVVDEIYLLCGANVEPDDVYIKEYDEKPGEIIVAATVPLSITKKAAFPRDETFLYLYPCLDDVMAIVSMAVPKGQSFLVVVKLRVKWNARDCLSLSSHSKDEEHHGTSVVTVNNAAHYDPRA